MTNGGKTPGCKSPGRTKHGRKTPGCKTRCRKIYGCKTSWL